MSQPPSRRHRDSPRNPNSRHSRTQSSLRHHPDDAASDHPVSLPDLNLIPQLDLCPDIDLFSDVLDPNFDHHDCSVDLDFGFDGHLAFSSFTESEEEEDVDSGLESDLQFQFEFEQHNLQSDGLPVFPIDSDSDDDIEGDYFGLGPVDFGLRLRGTDQNWIIDSEVESEGIISELDEIRSMSTGIDSHLSEFEFEFSSRFSNLEDFGSRLSNLEVFSPDESYMSFLEVPDDGLGQLVENLGVLRGFRPAAKSVVDELPVVEMGRLNVGACPICIDEFAEGEKATMLPCKHYYHGDCILPWLRERSTCPVCRYQLPVAEEDEESCWMRALLPAVRVDESDDDDALYWW